MTRRSNKVSAAFADDATTPITKDASSIPLPATFKDGLPLPKMMVFDLDYTLWPLWCDTHITAPIKRSPDGLAIKDRYGESYGFYNDVAGVLTAIKSHHIILGAASRTCAPEIAREMLSMFAVPGSGAKNALSLFDHLEIYPGSKTTHFAKLQKKSGEAYEEMLFFDDESLWNTWTYAVHLWSRAFLTRHSRQRFWTIACRCTELLDLAAVAMMSGA